MASGAAAHSNYGTALPRVEMLSWWLRSSFLGKSPRVKEFIERGDQANFAGRLTGNWKVP
jgi:hypothetical protein